MCALHAARLQVNLLYHTHHHTCTHTHTGGVPHTGGPAHGPTACHTTYHCLLSCCTYHLLPPLPTPTHTPTYHTLVASHTPTCPTCLHHTSPYTHHTHGIVAWKVGSATPYRALISSISIYQRRRKKKKQRRRQQEKAAAL